MSQYLALTLDVPVELSELAASLLHDADAQGVEIRDGELIPPPGVPPVPPGRAVIIGYFGEEADGGELLEWLREALEAQAEGQEIRCGFERLDQEEWAQTWKLHFKPLHVGGNFWVLPPWEEPPPGAVSVLIEPGLAFGTGGHASTALCLRGILDALERRADASVLDVGCGSGILGIAAAKLGAPRVLMLDNDPVAVQVAKENAAANGLPELESSELPVAELEERFDLVVANILANPLIELARPIAGRVEEGGELLLSGILTSQAQEVVSAYEAEGLSLRAELREGEWSMLSMGRGAA